MMYEVKFGLIGFVIGTVGISAAAISSSVSNPPSVVAEAQAPVEQIALLPTHKPMVQPVAPAKAEAPEASAPAKPMSAWRRAYIANHGHQPPVPAPKA